MGLEPEKFRALEEQPLDISRACRPSAALEVTAATLGKRGSSLDHPTARNIYNYIYMYMYIYISTYLFIYLSI